MKLLRDLVLLHALRGLGWSRRREAARVPRTITVPAPLAHVDGACRAGELPLARDTPTEPCAQPMQLQLRACELAAARLAAARAHRAASHVEVQGRMLQARRNKVLLSKLA